MGQAVTSSDGLLPPASDMLEQAGLLPGQQRSRQEIVEDLRPVLLAAGRALCPGFDAPRSYTPEQLDELMLRIMRHLPERRLSDDLIDCPIDGVTLLRQYAQAAAASQAVAWDLILVTEGVAHPALQEAADLWRRLRVIEELIEETWRDVILQGSRHKHSPTKAPDPKGR